MPGLDALLVVLKDDFDEIPVLGFDHVGCNRDLVVRLVDISWWFILDCIILEHLVGNLVVLGQLQWGVGILVGDTVDGIPQLAIYCASCVHQLDGSGDGDLTIDVRTLWVRSGSTCGQVPSQGAELIQGPSPAHWGLRERGGSRTLSSLIPDYGGGLEVVLGEPGKESKPTIF